MATKKPVAKKPVAKKTTAARPATAKPAAKSARKTVAKPATVTTGKVTVPKTSDIKLVGIVMGSTSDWEVMQEAAIVCKEFGVSCEARALSAHRSPHELEEWIKSMEARGCQAFIAGAGGAAHLAGVVAAQTILPTFGVPMPSKYMKGLDSLLATVQMPRGIPVPTLAIGEAGAANAALAIIAMLALNNPEMRKKLLAFRARQSAKVSSATLPALD